MCIDCDPEVMSPCDCEDGKSAFTITTADVTTTSAFENAGAGLSFPVSNVAPYTGIWAKKGSTVFIQNTNTGVVYGYYLVVSSTASTIVIKEHITPFVGGAAFANNTVDFQQHASGAITFPTGTSISPSGNKGTNGTAGIPASLEAAFHGSVTTADINPASTSYLTLASENIAAASLTDVGDSLRIHAKYYFSQDAASSSNGNAQILFGGTSITETPFSTEVTLSKEYSYADIKCLVTRVDNVTADVRIDVTYSALVTGEYTSENIIVGGGVYMPQLTYQRIGITVSALTSATTVVFRGSVGNTADRTKLGYYTVENLQKI